MTPADQQVLRQHSKRLLSLEVHLRPDDGDMFGLFRDGQKRKKPLVLIAGLHVRAWRQADLLHADGSQNWRLSPVGRAWVHRYTAEHDPFQEQHQLRIAAGTSLAPQARRNASQTPLAWLKTRSRGQKFGLTEFEFMAGEKLGSHYAQARTTQKTTMDWSRPVFVDGGEAVGFEDIPARQIEARRRLTDAMAYAGPGLADILLSVCCYEQGLEVCEVSFSLPQRSAKLMLKLGLMRLSVFYGFQSTSAAAASFRMR